MKKPHRYFDLADIRCPCGSYVKANLAFKKAPRRDLICFKCTQAASLPTQNPIRTGREVRKDPNLRSLKRIDKLIPLRRAYY
jgi:hypothetical protein